MARKNRLVSKNAFACTIMIAPGSYVVNGASQESGTDALATVQAENASNEAYPTEGNDLISTPGFKDFDATAKLAISGGSGTICKNMHFTIAGVTGEYVVTSVSNDTCNKALLAPDVTTIYFKSHTGGNLASSPANSAALTFITTFQLPPLRMERDITIVNNDTSNAISIYIQNLPGDGLHAMTQPANRFTKFPIGTLAASAAMTFEMSDASDIYVKGTSGSTITIFGS